MLPVCPKAAVRRSGLSGKGRSPTCWSWSGWAAPQLRALGPRTTPGPELGLCRGRMGHLWTVRDIYLYTRYVRALGSTALHINCTERSIKQQNIKKTKKQNSNKNPLAAAPWPASSSHFSGYSVKSETPQRAAFFRRCFFFQSSFITQKALQR